MSRAWVRGILWFTFWQLVYWAGIVEQSDRSSASFGGPFGMLSFDPAMRLMFAPVIWYGHLTFIHIAAGLWSAAAAAAITFSEDRLSPKLRGRGSAWFLGGTCALVLVAWWASMVERTQYLAFYFSWAIFVPAVVLAYISMFVALAHVVLRLHPEKRRA